MPRKLSIFNCRVGDQLAGCYRTGDDFLLAAAEDVDRPVVTVTAASHPYFTAIKRPDVYRSARYLTFLVITINPVLRKSVTTPSAMVGFVSVEGVVLSQEPNSLDLAEEDPETSNDETTARRGRQNKKL